MPGNTFAASNLVTDTVYTNLVPKTTLVPEEALGAFIGEDPNGVWTLTIADQTTGDGGSLANWSLDVVTLPVTPRRDDGVLPEHGRAEGDLGDRRAGRDLDGD